MKFWILAAALLMPWTFAGADTPRNEVVVGAGIASALHDNVVHLKDSLNIEAGYYRRFCPWSAIGVESGFFLGAKYGGVAPQAADTDGNGQADAIAFDENALAAVFRLTPEIKLGPILEGAGIRWFPYIAGGGGYYAVAYASTKGLPASVPSHAEHGGFNYGGGLTVVFPRGFGIGADMRWHQLIDRGAPDTAYRVPSLHITWFF